MEFQINKLNIATYSMHDLDALFIDLILFIFNYKELFIATQVLMRF